MGQIRTHQVVPPSYDDIVLTHPDAKKITGIGRNFYRELGLKAFRTACTVTMASNFEDTMATLRRKITASLDDPKSTCRLFVQGDRFWYSDSPAEELLDAILFKGEVGTAHAERFRDGHGELALPAAICVVEPAPASDSAAADRPTLVTWLFRHDVIDGWRVLRYLCTLMMERCDLTLDRLRQRHREKRASQKEVGTGVKIARGVGAVCGVTALAPLAAYRLLSVASGPSRKVDRRQYYMHAVCSLARLKELSSQHRLGGVTTALTACIAAAYFAAGAPPRAPPRAGRVRSLPEGSASRPRPHVPSPLTLGSRLPSPRASSSRLADATRSSAMIGTNVLFDPDATQGNHVCVKLASIQRGSTGTATLRGAASVMNSKSQALADMLIASLTQKFVKGTLPSIVTRSIEKRHGAMDILVSNLPAFDISRPAVLDLQTAREFTEWAPSIVYVIGVEDALFCDFYWGARPTFDHDVFMRTFQQITRATGVHTTLPACY